MQGGIWIDGKAPASKAAIKRALASQEMAVEFFNTSAFGPDSGRVYSVDCVTGTPTIPDGTHAIVGPDPYTKRNFYGTLTVKGGTVTVK